MMTEVVLWPGEIPGEFSVSRTAEKLTIIYTNSAGQRQVQDLMGWRGPVLVGLFTGSNDNSQLAKATFSGVTVK